MASHESMTHPVAKTEEGNDSTGTKQLISKFTTTSLPQIGVGFGGEGGGQPYAPHNPRPLLGIVHIIKHSRSVMS